MEGKKQISVKVSNINFHENPTGGSRTFPCGGTNGSITLLRVTFRFFFSKAFYNISLEVLETFYFDILLYSAFTALL